MRLLSMMIVLTLSTMWGGSVEAGPISTTEVAYVSEVSGRVVALMQGRPTLLDALDVVTDQTRLDLLANSEVRICHSRTHQVFILKGPLTAKIEQGGVTTENGTRAATASGSCTVPMSSTVNGGFISRGVP